MLFLSCVVLYLQDVMHRCLCIPYAFCRFRLHFLLYFWQLGVKYLKVLAVTDSISVSKYFASSQPTMGVMKLNEIMTCSYCTTCSYLISTSRP